MTYYTHMDTQIGTLLVAGDDDGVRVIGFPSGKGARTPEAGWVENPGPLREATRQLTAYFAGALTEFDLPLAPEGTPFQLTVWNALREIPYGETRSYGDIAAHIGKPSASRAVGAANGRNPLPIVIPCHRVIGSTGKLTGFGGGLDVKETLLALEQQHTTRPGSQSSLPFAAAG